ncbi:MAG: Modification methylase BamHI [Betaproteobacteria bacterium ADurb.Bin341]|nr:MAG: Modification methylase BamHI [Betaproteobacteria bacterium ADurb.Bin341]
MAVKEQTITDQYALYNGDCIETMKTLPGESVDMSVYSPPFCGLYNYSSNNRDLSNCRSYQEFFIHYGFVIAEIARLTKPGRISAVHVMDVPGRGNGETARMGCGANVGTGLIDFPGDVIRAHEAHGFIFSGRRAIWKEPLGVRNRTMAKGLAHKQIVDDSTLCDVASADYLLMFRKQGENAVPVTHPVGLLSYAGARKMPEELESYKGYTGKQTENRFSHWIWRQYASSVWDDIRIDRVLEYKESRDPEDERHVHPLQLDVIERACVLWSNPGEVVLTPFMGVGSEVYGAVANGRRGIGIELKPSYYRQAVKNLAACNPIAKNGDLFEKSNNTGERPETRSERTA